MDIVFFLNSITEFNHTLPIMNELKNWLIATESFELFQYIEENYSQTRVFKLRRQYLRIFKPKVVIFAGDWSLVKMQNLFSRRPSFIQIKTFHGIIDKKSIYSRRSFKDPFSFLFKVFYLLLKLKLKKISPLSDKPFKFIDKLELDRLIPNKYDLILLSGKMMGETLLKKRLLSPKNFAKVGVPKTDVLFTKQFSSKEVLEGLGLDGNKKTVLYAPTWSTFPNLCLSSIPKFGVAICKAIKKDVNFIFKPHQNVKRLNEFPKQLKKMKSIILQNSNMRFLDPDTDAVSLMRISDLLITDFSSVAIEYLLLNRPIIFVEHLGKRYSDPNLLDIQIRDAGELVNEAEKFTDTITYCLENPQKKSNTRIRFARNLFYYSSGKSSVLAAKAIESLL